MTRARLDPSVTTKRVLDAVRLWKAEAETQASQDKDSDNRSYYEGQAAAFELIEGFLTL